MAQPFILTAQIQFQKATNIGLVVKDIQKQLSQVFVPVKIKLDDPKAAGNLKNVHSQLVAIRNEINSVNAAATTAAASLNKMGVGVKAAGGLKQVSKAADKTKKSVKDVADNTKIAATEMQHFGQQSALAVRRFLAFSIPAGIVVSLVVGIRRAVGAAVDFEREMIKVAQVTGKTMTELSGIQNEIGRLAATFGVAAGDLATVSKTLSQAGLSARETQVALDALAKSSLAPTFGDLTQTTESLIAAMKQFKFPIEDASQVLSEMNAIAGSFAVEADDLGSAIRRAGGAFQATGGNLRELEALFTSVRATTRESADSIATGFRTIFTRLQRPRTIQFLKEMNIELSKAGKFVGGYEAIKRLSEALKDLDPRDFRFAQITEELGGFRQVSKVIPLIQQFGTAEKALAVAQAENNGLTDAAEKAQTTLAVQLAQTREEWIKLFRELAANDWFKKTASTALSFAQSLARVAESLKSLAAPMAAFLGLKILPSLFRFGGAFAANLHYAGAAGVGAGLAGAITGQRAGGATSQISNQKTDKLILSLEKLDKTIYKSARATWALGQLLRNKFLPLLTARKVPFGIGATTAYSRGPRITHSGGPVYHKGGRVRKADDVPIMAQKGEYIVNKKAVEEYGQGTFEAFNARKVKGFVGGGSSLRQSNWTMAASNAPYYDRGGNVSKFHKNVGLLSNRMFFLTFAITALADTFTTADSGISKFTHGLATLATTLFAFQIGIQALSPLPGFLRKLGSGNFISKRTMVRGRQFLGGGLAAQVRYGTPMHGGAPVPPGFRVMPYTKGARALTLGQRYEMGSRAFQKSTGFTYGAAGGLLGGAALFGGGIWLDRGVPEAARNAQSARELRRAQSRRQTAGILKGAGVGLAAGAYIGSIVPVIGTAVGAVVGTVTGALVGALTANTSELRALNRSTKFEKASERLAVAIQDLSEGRGGLTGAGVELGRMLDQIDTALVDKNDEQIKSFRDQLKSQIPALLDLKKQVIDNVSSFETLDKAFQAFEDAGGGLGSNIIRAYADATHQSFREVSRRIKEDIGAAIEGRKSREAYAKLEKQSYDTTRALRLFADKLYESALDVGRIGDSVKDIVAASKGRFDIPAFRGRKFFGEFGRGGEGKVVGKEAIDEFGKSLRQLLVPIGGDKGGEIAKDLTQAATLMGELPDILAQAASNWTLAGGEPLQQILEDLLTKKEGRYGAANIDLVVKKLGALVTGGNRQETEGEFLQLIREDRVAAAGKITSETLKSRYDLLDEMADNILSMSGKLEEAMQARVDMEQEIIKSLIDTSKSRIEAERTLFEARARGTGIAPESFPLERILNSVRQDFQTMTRGIPGFSRRNAMNPAAIGAALNKTKDDINRFRKILNESEDRQVRDDARQKLEQLTSSAQKLYNALNQLAQNTEELSAIQSELNRVQQDRQKSFDVLKEYTFGGLEDKTNILSTIGATITAAQTNSVRMLSEGMRKSVLQLAERFSTDYRAVFTDAEGRQRTGQQFIADVIQHDLVGPISKIWGPGIAKNFMDVITPSAEEDKLIAQMKEFFARQITAQEQLHGLLEKANNDLATHQKQIFDKFIQDLRSALFDSLISEKEEKLRLRKEEQTGLQSALSIGGQLKTYFDRIGASKKLPQFETGDVAIGKLSDILLESKTFEKLREQQDLKRFFGGRGKGGAPEAYGEFELAIKTLKQNLEAIKPSNETDLRAQVVKVLSKTSFKDFKLEDIITQLIGKPSRVRGFYGVQEPRVIGKPELLENPQQLYEKLLESTKAVDINESISKTIKELELTLIQGVYGFNTSWEDGRTAINQISADLLRVGSELNKFAKNIEGLNKAGIKFDDTGKKLEDLSDEIEKLKKELEELKLKKATPQARGGSIFAPTGTDTVPAMLTPGEFVVKRAATQKYLPILKSINAMKFQGGDIVPDKVIDGLWKRYGKAYHIDPTTPLPLDMKDKFYDYLKTQGYSIEDKAAPGSKLPFTVMKGGVGGKAGEDEGVKVPSFGGVDVLSPQQLAEAAYEKFKYLQGARSKTGGLGRRKSFEEYEKDVKSLGVSGAYTKHFKEAWDAANIVYKAWTEDRFHPFGGIDKTRAIEEKYGIKANELLGMRPDTGRFFKKPKTNEEKAYNELVKQNIRYRTEKTEKGVGGGTGFNASEIATITAPIGNKRATKLLMPDRFWDQWMRLREELKKVQAEAYVPQPTAPHEIKPMTPEEITQKLPIPTKPGTAVELPPPPEVKAPPAIVPPGTVAVEPLTPEKIKGAIPFLPDWMNKIYFGKPQTPVAEEEPGLPGAGIPFLPDWINKIYFGKKSEAKEPPAVIPPSTGIKPIGPLPPEWQWGPGPPGKEEPAWQPPERPPLLPPPAPPYPVIPPQVYQGPPVRFPKPPEGPKIETEEIPEKKAKKRSSAIKIGGRTYYRGTEEYEEYIGGAKKGLGRHTRPELPEVEKKYEPNVLPDYIRNKPPGIRERLAREYYETGAGKPRTAVDRERLNEIMGYTPEAKKQDIENLKRRQDRLHEFYRDRYQADTAGNLPALTEQEKAARLKEGRRDYQKRRGDAWVIKNYLDAKKDVEEFGGQIPKWIADAYFALQERRRAERAAKEEEERKHKLPPPGGRKIDLDKLGTPILSKQQEEEKQLEKRPKFPFVEPPPLKPRIPPKEEIPEKPKAKTKGLPLKEFPFKNVPPGGFEKPPVPELPDVDKYSGFKKASEARSIIDKFVSSKGLPTTDRLGLKVLPFVDDPEAPKRTKAAPNSEVYGYFHYPSRSIYYGKSARDTDLIHEYGHALDQIIGQSILDIKGILSPKNQVVFGSSESKLIKDFINKYHLDLVEANTKSLGIGVALEKPDYAFNPREMFAEMIAGTTPEHEKLREKFLKLIIKNGKLDLNALTGTSSFAHGGYVKGPPGVDNVPALLSSGEYVLSRGMVQAFKNGGLVKSFQEGGAVGTGFDTTLFESSIEKFSTSVNSLNKIADKMSGFATQLADLTLPDSIKLDSTNFDGASRTLNESLLAFGRSINDIPREIRVQVEASGNQPVATGNGEIKIADLNFNDFKIGVDGFGVHVTSFGSGIADFGTHIASMHQAVGNFQAAVSALNQGFEITARYTVDVNLNGADAFAQMKADITNEVKTLVGRQIENLTRRMGDLGPDMQNGG